MSKKNAGTSHVLSSDLPDQSGSRSRVPINRECSTLVGISMKSDVSKGLSLLLAFVAAIALLVSAACGGGSQEQIDQETTPVAGRESSPVEQTGQVGEKETPVTGVIKEKKEPLNRIVYVGNDNQIYTLNPDGSDVRRLTQEGLYSWPTWSPDGENLVFSGIARSNSGNLEIGLYMAAPPDGEVRTLYVNDPEVPALIAPDMLHYAAWAPSSQKIAFIAQTADSGLTLHIDNPHDDWNPVIAAGGAPLYFSWSPNSSHLIVHRGEDLFLVDVEDNPEPRDLRIGSASFRPPAWSPNGDKIVFGIQDAFGVETLFMADSQGQNRQAIGELKGSAAFLWSPKGESIALARTSALEEFIYRELQLLSKDGSLERTLTNETLNSFFWSPDSTKIIYGTSPDDDGVMKWVLIDIKTGIETTLVEFIPSNELFIMLFFFDQFVYSHSLWSPDSKSFVFAGEVTGVPSLAAYRSQEEPRIYVLDVEGGTGVKSIADGTMAFWSFR